MSAPLSAVDSGLNHHDDTLGVRESIGFGEGTSTQGAARIRWRVSEDKFSEKEPRLEWYYRTRAIVSGHIQISFEDIWF